jgi:hypothetical protein
MQLELNICDEILLQLKVQRRSIRWLAKQINCDHSSLNRRLKEHRSMNSDLLVSISDVLKICFLQKLADASVRERNKQKQVNNDEHYK